MNITITRFPFESQLGGMETVVLNLAKGLRKKGHTVSFAGNCPVLLDLFEDNGFVITELTIPRSPVSFGSIFLFLFLYPFILFQFFRIIAPMKKGDVLYMLSLSEKIVMTKMAAKKGIKVVWGEHEALMYGDKTFRNWLYKNPFLGIYKKNSRLATVITVSPVLQKEFETLGGVSHLICIPNGVDTDFFTPNFIHTYQQKGGKFIVGTVSRLKKEKGVEAFLQVAEKVIPRIPNAHFVIAGEGPEKEYLLHLVHEKKIERHVVFLGEISHEQIREVYTMFDVALFLSKELETFGLTPLEAMAMKKATILSSAFGFLTPEIQEKLVVVESHEIQNIAQGIIAIYKDQRLQEEIEKKGYEIVLNHFSLHRMVEKYEAVFQNSFL